MWYNVASNQGRANGPSAGYKGPGMGVKWFQLKIPSNDRLGGQCLYSSYGLIIYFSKAYTKVIY